LLGVGLYQKPVTFLGSTSTGLRWSHESKDVEVASLSRNVNHSCSVVDGTCLPDFTGSISKSSWAPRVGVQYEFSPSARGYASYARAYRAGGFNFRNTAADTVNFGPGPFGDEKVDSWELGIKTEPFGRARLNFAGFYTKIGNMQREVNLADPNAGVVQVIKNTADARLVGFEADFAIPLADGVVLDGSLGYVDGNYTRVVFDINGDGVLNDDLALKIPRLAPLTANIGLTVEKDLPLLGKATFRATYAHRDPAAYTDNNRGMLNAANRVDASLAFKVLDDRGTITIFGQNLTNNVQIGGDTQLPATLGGVPLGGTFAPLSKGRTFGIELRISN
ncbi:MAG TPA: TonB-dependent receptor, partial [Novosphingobium sp.]|nr:TonB-dependent receptor [Novosphingobium sp.]HQA17506.1 TonB-dependent receptor [Novosphingobium sp.]